MTPSPPEAAIHRGTAIPVVSAPPWSKARAIELDCERVLAPERVFEARVWSGPTDRRVRPRSARFQVGQALVASPGKAVVRTPPMAVTASGTGSPDPRPGAGGGGLNHGRRQAPAPKPIRREIRPVSEPQAKCGPSRPETVSAPISFGAGAIGKFPVNRGRKVSGPMR